MLSFLFVVFFLKLKKNPTPPRKKVFSKIRGLNSINLWVESFKGFTKHRYDLKAK